MHVGFLLACCCKSGPSTPTGQITQSRNDTCHKAFVTESVHKLTLLPVLPREETHKQPKMNGLLSTMWGQAGRKYVAQGIKCSRYPGGRVAILLRLKLLGSCLLLQHTLLALGCGRPASPLSTCTGPHSKIRLAVCCYSKKFSTTFSWLGTWDG